jgi:hypothetical protein
MQREARIWQGWRRKPRPAREPQECGHGSDFWRRLRGKPEKILLRGTWYCAESCLEKALSETIQQLQLAARSSTAPPHRIPLGLMLLSRQQVTPERLRIAVEAQRFAGHGKIGEWLQSLGFANEQQITAALARQWACPIRRTLPSELWLSRAPKLPVFLLHSSAMIPIEYVESTGTLHMAFGEGVDRNMLYSIEQMLGCRTEACLIVPSLLQQSLHAWFDRRGPHEVVFDRVEDMGECVRIVRSYWLRMAAAEIRLAVCGPCLWIRLLGSAKGPLDLLFRSPTKEVSAPPVPSLPLPVIPPKVLPAPADKTSGGNADGSAPHRRPRSRDTWIPYAP